MVIAPARLIGRLFQLAHSSPRAGHLGVRRTIARIQESFYWPMMSLEIADLVRQCQPCGCRKQLNLAKMPLKPITAEQPFEVMGADLAGPLPVKSKRGHRYILVLVDKFSKYIAAYPLKHASTDEIVAAFNWFIADFDAPSRLITDRGSCFTSKVFRGWCLARGIAKKRTTSYYPKGDGMTERAVQTVKNMLFCVCPDLGQDWDRALPLIVEAYRKSSNDCLDGMTPYQVVRGVAPIQQPSLLLGQVAGDAALDENATPEEHGIFIASEIERVTALASVAVAKAMKEMKVAHDRRVPKHRKFFVGDRVRKLLPPDQQVNFRFSEQIFVVLQETNDDIFLIKPFDADEPIDTVNGAKLKLFARSNGAAMMAAARTATSESSSTSTATSVADEASMDPESSEGSTSCSSPTNSSKSTTSTGNSEETIVPAKRNRKQAKFVDYAQHIRVAKWIGDSINGTNLGLDESLIGQADPLKSIGCGELAPRGKPAVGGSKQP
jgi:Integrase zinc binding domain/Integrase core domain